jgi:hypothetical protein
VSEFNPTDIGFTRRPLSDPPPDEAAERVAGDELPRREREGLPSSYRMRADSHYVDLLTKHPSGGERPAPAAARPTPHRRASDVPGDDSPRDVQDPRGERLLGELSEELATITSAAALLSTDPSPMARRVSLDLIRAQTWRASWMLRAHGLLHGSHRPRMQSHEVGALLARVRDGFAAECRLAGTSLELRVPAWTAAVTVDEDALLAGLSGAVIWTLGGAGAADGAAITMSADATDGWLDVIDVSQEPAGGTAPAPRRAYGGPAPAGEDWMSALGASVAKAAARIHGADAAFLAGDGGRSTVRFTFRRAG